jgi:hypothetical protein
MTLAGDSILVTPGTGATVATHSAGGKEHQVVMIAGPDGHLQDSFPTYYYWSGFVAGAANRKHLEIFNATGSGVKIIVRKIFIQSNMATAVHVAQQWDLDRSSAVGTGGTTITANKADSTNTNVPANVTARAGPTGGATKSGGTLFSIGLNAEETLPAAAMLGMINWVPEGPNIQEITLREGEGLYAMQVTSSATTLWGVLFVVNII